MRHPAMTLLAVAATALPAEAAEKPWTEVRTPHFRLVGNAGEGEIRDAAWQFEQVRTVFRTIWPWARRDETRPFVVFVVKDERTLRSLGAKYFEAVRTTYPTAIYASGPDADYVAMRVDVDTGGDARVNLYLTAFRGYADNLLVRHFRAALPPWFREGFGEVLANTLVRDKDVELGRVIPWHLRQLTGSATLAPGRGRSEDRRTLAPSTAALLPLPRLVAVERGDPEYASEAARWMFEAQSWAFVHYLMFGDGGAHRPKFNRLAALMRDGTPAAEAVSQALGDVDAYTAGFRKHVAGRTLPFARIAVDIDVSREKWSARPLPVEEEAALRNAMQAAMEPRAAPSPAPATASAAASAQDLIAACNRGDEDACRRLAPALQSACDAGDLALCMPLAWLHAKGRGVDLDVLKAEALYSRACEGGEPKACASLARSLLARSEEAADRARAAELLAKACAGGVTAACGTK